MSGTIATLPSYVEDLTAKEMPGRHTEIEVLWSKPSGEIKKYEIEWWRDSDNVKSCETSSTFCRIYVENDSYPHSIQVAAINKSGRGKFRQVSHIEKAPQAPKSLSLSHSVKSPESEVLVEIDDPAYEQEYYEIKWKSLTEDDNEGEKKTSSTTKVLTGLSPGDKYKVSVVKLRNKMKSLPLHATIQTYPAKLDRIVFSKTSATTVRISWQKVIGATEYQLKWKGSDRNYATEIVYDTDYTLDNLERGHLYFVQIAAVSQVGRGEFSDEIKFHTDLPPPTNVIAKPLTIGKSICIELTFNEASQNTKSYCGGILSRGREETFTTENCFHTISDVEGGVRYMIYLQAIGENGLKSEKVFSGPILTNPAEVKDIKVTRISSGVVKLRWEAVPGAKTYMAKCMSEKSKDQMKKTDDLQICFKDLDYNDNISFSLVAENESGTGIPSDPVDFETDLSPPTSIQVHNIPSEQTSGISTEFQSDYYEGISYEVAVIERPMNIVVRKETRKECHAKFYDLKSGQQYVISVRSMNRNNTNQSPVVYSDPIWTFCDKVCNVTSHSLSRQSSHLKWDRISGAKEYKVQWKSEDDRGSQTVGDAECLLHDLKLGHIYSVTVSASNNAGIGQASEIAYVITGMLPPTNLVIQKSSESPDTGVEISFDEPQIKPKAYLVACIGISKNHQRQITLSSNFTKLSNLLPGVEYNVFVQSIGDQEVLMSEKLHGTFWTCPGKVQELNVNMESFDSQNISWSTVTGAEKYEVEWRKKGKKAEMKKVNGTNTLLEDLDLNSQYTVAVRAINLAGNGRLSDVQRFKTALNPPSNVTLTKDDKFPSSAVKVKFSYPKVRAKMYRIRLLSITKCKDVYCGVTQNNFATIPKLESSGSYKAFVCSIDEEYESLNSEESSSGEHMTSPAKLDVKVTSVSSNKQKISWPSIALASEYKVEWRIENKPWNSSITTENEMVLEDLEHGQNYEVHVVAYNEGGEGDYSDLMKFTTVPAVPENLHVEILKTCEVLITCNQTRGTDQYQFNITAKESGKLFRSDEKSPKHLFKYSGDSVNFKVEVCAMNCAGKSVAPAVVEYRQVLSYLQKKYEKMAQNLLPLKKYIEPLLHEHETKRGLEFDSAFDCNNGDTHLFLGGQFAGKTAILSHYIQAMQNNSLILYLDYEDVIRALQKQDVKSFLKKFMTDITAEEMEFVFEWMKDNSQQVTLAVDNVSFKDGYEGRLSSYNEKATTEDILFNLISTKREIFPKSTVVCTTLHESVCSIIKPNLALTLDGFNDAAIDKMSKVVMNGQAIPKIPDHLKFLCINPCYCEIIVLLLTSRTKHNIDMASSASVYVEVLRTIMNRCTEKVKQRKLNLLYKAIMAVEKEYKSKVSLSPTKVPKIKRKPRESLRTITEGSVPTDLPSMMDFSEAHTTVQDMDSQFTSRTCLRAMYIAFFLTDKDFKKQFGNRGFNIHRHANMWALVAGFFRTETMESFVELFKPVVAINSSEVLKKSKNFNDFISHNMKDILDQIYVDHLIPLDWASCCIELNDDQRLEDFSPEIKIKDGFSDEALDQTASFLRLAPRQICGNIKIKRKTDTPATISLAIDRAIKENPHGETISQSGYEPTMIGKRLSHAMSSFRSRGHPESSVTNDLQIRERDFHEEYMLKGRSDSFSSSEHTFHSTTPPGNSLVVEMPDKISDTGHYKVTAESVNEGTKTVVDAQADTVTISDLNPGDGYKVKIFEISEKSQPILRKQSVKQIDKIIDEDGGTVRVGKCELKFPPKCVAQPTKVHILPTRQYPELPKDFVEIAPAYEFYSSVKQFLQPVECSVETWVTTTSSDVKVYIFDQKGDQFKEIDQVPLASDGIIRFKCHHFSIRRFAIKIKSLTKCRFQLYMSLFYGRAHNNFCGIVCPLGERYKSETKKELNDEGWTLTPIGFHGFKLYMEESITFRLCKTNKNDEDLGDTTKTWQFTLQQIFFKDGRNRYVFAFNNHEDEELRLRYKANKSNNVVQNEVFNFIPSKADLGSSEMNIN